MNWFRRNRTARPSAGDIVYDLRVAESALKVIERELERIPSSVLGDNWKQIVNMDAAVGAWRRGLIAQPPLSVTTGQS